MIPRLIFQTARPPSSGRDSIQRVPLHRLKAGAADHAAQLPFCGAVAYAAGGADDVFFEHHRANVVAAEAPRLVGLAARMHHNGVQ